MSYIDKRVLNPFFKKTNSTPQDLLDWVNFLIKECSDLKCPCINHKQGMYMADYDIFNGMVSETCGRIGLDIYKNSDVLQLWWNYVDGDKETLPKIIKEFKRKYKL